MSVAETSGPKRYERGSEEFARTLALSDGVFAIALTLLVVSIGLPTIADAQSASALWAAVADLSPDFVSFVVSFVVIGRYWIAHQRQFSMLARMNGGFIGLNLLYLAGIAFLPFPTDLLGTYFQNPVALGIYAVCVGLVSGMEIVLCPLRPPRRPAHATGALRHLPLGNGRLSGAGGGLRHLHPDRVPEHHRRRIRLGPDGASRARPRPLQTRVCRRVPWLTWQQRLE